MISAPPQSQPQPSPAHEAGPLPVMAKYGEAGRAGFQAVPDILLKKQDVLGLSATELVVLLNILMHWWYPAQKPFPRSSTIAHRMGISTRTVQRAIQRIEDELKLLSRTEGTEGETFLDPTLLVNRLEELVKDDPSYLHRTGRLAAT